MKTQPTTIEVDPDLQITMRAGSVAVATRLSRTDAMRLAASLCQFVADRPTRLVRDRITQRVDLTAHHS